MLHYQKGPEPDELKQLRSTPGASYESLGGSNKDAVRRALIQDQGALCAYCQQRISDSESGMKIEHWQSQSLHPDKQLNWSNLLGVCRGESCIEGKKVRHCDTSRGDLQPEKQALFLSPMAGTGASARDHLKYTADGKVRSDDPQAQRDIRTLNLDSDADVHLLRSNRQAAWAELLRSIQRKGYKLGTVNDLLARCELQSGTRASPYVEMTRYLLLKMSHRLSRFP